MVEENLCVSFGVLGGREEQERSGGGLFPYAELLCKFFAFIIIFFFLSLHDGMTTTHP